MEEGTVPTDQAPPLGPRSPANRTAPIDQEPRIQRFDASKVVLDERFDGSEVTLDALPAER